MLLMLLSTLRVIRQLIYGNNYSFLLILNLAYENTVNWGRKWLLGFNTGKTHLVSFERSKHSGAVDVKNYLLGC